MRLTTAAISDGDDQVAPVRHAELGADRAQHEGNREPDGRRQGRDVPPLAARAGRARCRPGSSPAGRSPASARRASGLHPSASRRRPPALPPGRAARRERLRGTREVRAAALIAAAASENGASAAIPGVPMSRFMPRSPIMSAAIRPAGHRHRVPQRSPLNGVNAPLHLWRRERQCIGGRRPGRRQHAHMLGCERG